MDKVSGIQLSIVFLNYNRIIETQTTVNRLFEMVGNRSDIEVIAVDNNSKDGTAEFLASQSWIKAVLLNSNDGIAGYNKGFAKAKGHYILVLDDDSCPADSVVLDTLITYLDNNEDAGVIACHIETPDGKPQWKWHLPEPNKSSESPFFIGCGFAIRRSLFQEIGWYPGEFFLYQNEIDVAFKVRQRGYGIYYLAECKVIHRGVLSKRPGWRCVYYPTRNTIWIIRKYYSHPQATYMICSRIFIGLGRALYLGQLKAFVTALRDAFDATIDRTPLSSEIKKMSRKFYFQNSIFHQILRLI